MTREELLRMEVGQSKTVKEGHLKEIHRVPDGWIYLFYAHNIGSGTDQTALSTTFVPEVFI